MRTFVAVLIAAVAAAAVYAFYVRAVNPCGVGSRFDVLTARCQPVGGSGLSTSTGGGASGTQNAGNVKPQNNNNCPPGSPPGCGQAPPGDTGNFGPCSFVVSACTVSPDMTMGNFELGWSSGGSKTSITKVRTTVFMEFMQRDAGGVGCTSIKGTFDASLGGPAFRASYTVPFDDSIASKYPMATTSGSVGPVAPTLGLTAEFKPECHPATTQMVVFPVGEDPNICGCRQKFTR